MKKSIAQTNQKLVSQLISKQSLKAVKSALDRGEITPRQAQNITKFIRTAKTIRESAGFSAVVLDETSGQYVGEVVSKNRGASWIGLRYGPNYPHDSAEFAEQNDAMRFVGQTLHQVVTETKIRNAAIPAEEMEAVIDEALAAVRAERFGSQERATDPDTSNASTEGDEFTPEQQERIRAHIKARGITFEVFLPDSLANWLREKIAAGAFKDAAEAAFVAFQNLQELDRHPYVKEQLLRATIEARLKDPRPGIPLEEFRANHRAQLREWANREPPGE